MTPAKQQHSLGPQTGLKGRSLTLCEDNSFNFGSEKIKIRKKVKQKGELERWLTQALDGRTDKPGLHSETTW